ncbi:RusA family crossover junction endodeoxyribonuclease [Streptomyces sp. SGAir0957]
MTTTATRTFTLTLPRGLKLLNANQRVHHRVRADLTHEIRSAAHTACSENEHMRAALAAANPHPVLQQAYILGVLHPGSRRRIDPANFYPSFKAAVDGLVDAGVLEDDDHTHVVGPDMRIGPIVKGGQLTLVIQEITPATHAAFQWAAHQPATAVNA